MSDDWSYPNEKPPERKNMFHVVHCPHCDKCVRVECSEYSTHIDYENRLIVETKTDLDYIWFILDEKGIWDEITPGDYKKLHAIKKKWEARSK